MSDGVDVSSLSFQDQFSLRVNDVFATLTKTSQEHDERHVGGAGRNHRRDHSSFAVPDEADHLWIELFPLSKKIDSGHDVLGEIFARCRKRPNVCSANATIVNSEYGDAVSRQMIGEHEERTMSRDRLVAVLWSTAGYQQHDRVWTTTTRNR